MEEGIKSVDYILGSKQVEFEYMEETLDQIVNTIIVHLRPNDYSYLERLNVDSELDTLQEIIRIIKYRHPVDFSLVMNTYNRLQQERARKEK